MNIAKNQRLIPSAILLAALAACHAPKPNVIRNARGVSTLYENPEEQGRTSGIGIDSRDIIASSDRMVRSMMREPFLQQGRPRIILDHHYFEAETSVTFNRRMITDRMRVALSRAARGKMRFIGRENTAMVLAERELKDRGVADAGSLPRTGAIAGADYRMVVNLTELAADRHDQLRSRYYQLVCKLVDLETSEEVWQNIFEIKKTGQDDIIYR